MYPNLMFYSATRNRCSTKLIYTATKQSYNIKRYKTLKKERMYLEHLKYK